MAVLTKGKVGWVPETTYGVRASISAASYLRAFGRMFGTFPIPVEKYDFATQSIGSSFDYNNMAFTNKDVEFDLPFWLDDAREIYYAFGKNADAGGPTYTHTITAMEPSDAFTLPSRTFHNETQGLTTNKYQDVPGTLVKEAEWKIAFGDPNGLMQTNKFTCQRVTDENATTNLYGVTSGGSADLESSTGGSTSKAIQYNEFGIRLLTFVSAGYVDAVAGDIGAAAAGVTTGHGGILLAYDNTLRQWIVASDSATDLFNVAEEILTPGTGTGTTEAGSSAYKNPSPRIGNDQEAFLLPKNGASNVAISVGGIDLTPYWKALGFKVVNTYSPASRSQRAGTTNYGISMSQYKQGDFLVDRSHFVALTLDFADAINTNFLSEIMKETLTQQTVLTFERENDSAETLVWTYNASVSPMEKYEFPQALEELSQAPIVITWRPKSLVSCVKTDTFATLL